MACEPLLYARDRCREGFCVAYDAVLDGTCGNPAVQTKWHECLKVEVVGLSALIGVRLVGLSALIGVRLVGLPACAVLFATGIPVQLIGLRLPC